MLRTCTQERFRPSLLSLSGKCETSSPFEAVLALLPSRLGVMLVSQPRSRGRETGLACKLTNYIGGHSVHFAKFNIWPSISVEKRQGAIFEAFVVRNQQEA